MQIKLDFDNVVVFRSKVTNENCSNKTLQFKVKIQKNLFLHLCKLVNVSLPVSNTGVKVIERDGYSRASCSQSFT